jgi:hypothetical protein
LHSSISFFILFVLSIAIAIVKELSTMHHHTHQYPLPCLYCHPHSYIRMVINLLYSLSFYYILINKLCYTLYSSLF